MRKPESLISLLIFVLMEDKPRYGYELLKEMEEISGGYWQPGQGTVYGALERLEGNDLIEEVEYEPEEDEGNSRQYYGLTEKGRGRLEKCRKKYEESFNPRDRVLGLLYVYRFLAGEDEFERLIEKIKGEFLAS